MKSTFCCASTRISPPLLPVTWSRRPGSRRRWRRHPRCPTGSESARRHRCPAQTAVGVHRKRRDWCQPTAAEAAVVPVPSWIVMSPFASRSIQLRPSGAARRRGVGVDLAIVRARAVDQQRRARPDLDAAPSSSAACPADSPGSAAADSAASEQLFAGLLGTACPGPSTPRARRSRTTQPCRCTRSAPGSMPRLSTLPVSPIDQIAARVDGDRPAARCLIRPRAAVGPDRSTSPVDRGGVAPRGQQLDGARPPAHSTVSSRRLRAMSPSGVVAHVMVRSPVDVTLPSIRMLVSMHESPALMLITMAAGPTFSWPPGVKCRLVQSDVPPFAPVHDPADHALRLQSPAPAACRHRNRAADRWTSPPTSVPPTQCDHVTAVDRPPARRRAKTTANTTRPVMASVSSSLCCYPCVLSFDRSEFRIPKPPFALRRLGPCCLNLLLIAARRPSCDRAVRAMRH